MKHSIKSRRNIDSHNMIVTVELLPENDLEKKVLKNVQAMTASDEERDLVENYLHFSLGLGNYSVLMASNQTNNIATLKIFVE